MVLELKILWIWALQAKLRKLESYNIVPLDPFNFSGGKDI